LRQQSGEEAGQGTGKRQWAQHCARRAAKAV
jgi:hypothetical protein